jgi:hypothetical protein
MNISHHLQTTSPGFTGGTSLRYSQTGSTVVLTVVRPLAHPTHPINPTGTTNVIFATGPSSASVPIEEHTGVNDVRACA